jgi:hypothetical protein
MFIGGEGAAVGKLEMSVVNCVGDCFVTENVRRFGRVSMQFRILETKHMHLQKQMAPCLGMQNATQYTRFNRHFIYIINLL